jgi:hypothetical protein
VSTLVFNGFSNTFADFVFNLFKLIGISRDGFCNPLKPNSQDYTNI